MYIYVLYFIYTLHIISLSIDITAYLDVHSQIEKLHPKDQPRSPRSLDPRGGIPPRNARGSHAGSRPRSGSLWEHLEVDRRWSETMGKP